MSDADRHRLAGELGAFLRALHGVEITADLPDDPFGRVDMHKRVPLARERLADGERLGLWTVPGAVGDLLDAAHRLPPAAPSVVAHGDLHARHVLVGEHGALAGVIDWGDLCRADPSSDLSLLWSLLPAQARPGFLDAYGPVSPDQLLRARVLALFLNAVLAIYAHHEGMAALEREAIEGLARAWQERRAPCGAHDSNSQRVIAAAAVALLAAGGGRRMPRPHRATAAPQISDSGRRRPPPEHGCHGRVAHRGRRSPAGGHRGHARPCGSRSTTTRTRPSSRCSSRRGGQVRFVRARGAARRGGDATTTGRGPAPAASYGGADGGRDDDRGRMAR